METSIKLNVFFEEAFWVGVFKKTYDEQYEVAKIIFGTEPKDYEVFEFILKEFYNLSFSKPMAIGEIEHRKINPKRYQREIKKEIQNKGAGTKAQLAMKLQQENNKIERKKTSRQEKEEENLRKFELRQQKKSEKHRGH
jgi:hypothetical protein